MMTLRAMLLLSVVAVAVCGCTNSTEVSRQPSEQEIQDGINRRIKAIDDDPNMTPQAKEMAKQRIQGSSGAADGRGK